MLVGEALSLRAGSARDATPQQRDDLGRLAELLLRTARPDSARIVADRRLALERAADPPDDVRLAGALAGLASIDAAVGRSAEARALLGESAGLLREAPGEAEGDLATVLEALADAERSLDDLLAAEATAREALEIRRRIHPSAHPAVATAEIHLAQVLDARGRRAEAADVYRRALVTLDATLGADHFITQRSRNNYANVLMELGDPASAEAIYRRQLAEHRQRLGAGAHPDVGTALQNLAAALVRQDETDEPDALSAEASEIFRQVYGPGHPGVAVPLLTRSEIRLIRGDGPGAEAFTREALRILEASLPKGHYVLATASCRLAAALDLQGRTEEAEPAASAALDALLQAGNTPPRLVEECRRALTTIRARGAA